MTYEFQGRTRAKAEADGRRGRADRAPRSTERNEPRQPIHGFAALMGLVFLLAGRPKVLERVFLGVHHI